jgi:F0F1-type ATP synthase epsilon subunit
MPIRCEIVSQDRLVFEGDADIIVVPGVNGEMGILPHHAPLLSTSGLWYSQRYVAKAKKRSSPFPGV